MSRSTQNGASPSVSSDAGGLSVVLSPSQLTTFMACEEQWVRDQARPRGEDGHRVETAAPGLGASRGTAIHALLAIHEAGGDWRAEVHPLASRMFPAWSPEWQLPDVIREAVRLVERHEAAFTLPLVQVATEWQFKVRHPGDRNLEITGYQDGLFIVNAQDDPIHTGLWVKENKSMSQWNRLDWLPDDPQPATYMWAARAQGFNIRGLLYDAIYTAEWKEEREPSASFRRLWMEYDQAAVDRTLDAYARAAARIRELRAGSTPTLSIGKTCTSSYCPFVAECRGHAS